MKKNFKLAALALGAMTAGVMASCTAESGFLNTPEVPETGSGVVTLSRASEVSAHSNGIVINSLESGLATSAFGEVGYDYNFPAQMQAVENIVIPSDAVRYNGSYQQSGTYYVDGDHEGGLYFDNNATLTVYVKPGAKITEIGWNITKLDLYICEGAEVTISNYSMNNCAIYNAGTLNLPNAFDGQKITAIYNTGNVYIGQNVSWGYELHSDTKIYSEGYVEFNVTGEWSEIKINGTIVSSNIVKANGHIKLQSNGYCDICYLIGTDWIDIVDGTNICGHVEAPNMRFDGAQLKLHPEGWVDIENEINMPNSGCQILAYNDNSEGLVECETLSIHMTNDPLATAIGKGLYLNVGSIYNQANGQTYTNFSGLSVGSPNHINTGYTPKLAACGAVQNGDDNPEIEDPEDPETEDPEDPETDVPTVAEIPEHIEVNLEVEKHQDYLATHLSIHVRAVTDVEVFIPVPASYYVDADDMAIVEKHEENWMIHGGPDVTTYNIDGNIVTLTVNFEPEGIRVTTNGVNEAVIDYLKDVTGDGLTFEVWNYYNDSINEKELRDYLGEHISTVEFLDATPQLYVNAFFFDDAFDSDGVWTGYNKDQINPWDCPVEIIDSQKGEYQGSKTDYFYNASPFNELYYKL